MTHDKRTVPVNNGKFQVELLTGGDGPPLLYLHGSDGLRGWTPYLEKLAETFTVHAPSHPGWGESTGLEHMGEDIRDLAGFYLDFMDALGLEQAHLVGHSLGGMLAAEIAAMDRSYVERLVLVNSAGVWLNDQPMPDLFAMTLQELAPLVFHDPTGPVARSFGVDLKDMEAVQGWYLRQYQSFGAASRFLWPIPDQGTQARLHRLTMPTLLLWGESDRLIPTAYGEVMRDAIPGARLEIIPQAGHMTLDEQTGPAVSAINAFLNGGG